MLVLTDRGSRVLAKCRSSPEFERSSGTIGANKMHKIARQVFVIAVVGAVTCGVGGVAAAQDLTYDDEMYCRFVLYGVVDQDERSPRDIATNTNVGGYYWTSIYGDYERDDGAVEHFERARYWFYPWTLFEDDARLSKGVAVRFAPRRRPADGSVVWRADEAYPVGFTPLVQSGGSLHQQFCQQFFRDASRHVDWDVEPLKWGAPSSDDCSWLRERAEGPHPAPPGCD